MMYANVDGAALIKAKLEDYIQERKSEIVST